MGNYVLYLMMQAFVALIFAYFSGTLLFRQRRLYMLLACAGFYLLMGSALLEVWGDKAGWTPWAIGANAALVATGVAAFGAGALLREAEGMADPVMAGNVARVFIGVAAVMGVVLATTGGTSDAIVRPGALPDANISGSFGHLGPAGWALGSPVLVGALALSWLGMRAFALRRELGGLWFVAGGVLFLLWPFDMWAASLPLSPAIFMLATATTYFGFQSSSEEEEVAADDGGKDEGEPDGGTAPWVMEAAEAQGSVVSDGTEEREEDGGRDTGKDADEADVVGDDQHGADEVDRGAP